MGYGSIRTEYGHTAQYGPMEVTETIGRGSIYEMWHPQGSPATQSHTRTIPALTHCNRPRCMVYNGMEAAMAFGYKLIFPDHSRSELILLPARLREDMAGGVAWEQSAGVGNAVSIQMFKKVGKQWEERKRYNLPR